MTARVAAGGRLHVGFCNLSLAHERLYGGVGLALAAPRTVVLAEPAEGVEAPEDAQPYVERVVDRLGVPGATVRLEERLPRHVGLGSGTQLALAVHAAIARVHGYDPDPRGAAPALGRGGRSGIGVAAFERGGFLVDAGHPTERFTAEAPEPGAWTVPAVAARHPIPSDWRFVLAIPDAEPGPSGPPEEEHMRAAVRDADPAVADEVAAVLVRRLLPAAATGDLAAFGSAVAEIGRLNGAWYADEQGGTYRPPAGAVIDELRGSPAVEGAGQSSWGPTVYGVTDASRAEAARGAARDALAAAGVGGEVRVVQGRNTGALAATEE